MSPNHENNEKKIVNSAKKKKRPFVIGKWVNCRLMLSLQFTRPWSLSHNSFHPCHSNSMVIGKMNWQLSFFFCFTAQNSTSCTRIFNYGINPLPLMSESATSSHKRQRNSNYLCFIANPSEAFIIFFCKAWITQNTFQLSLAQDSKSLFHFCFLLELFFAFHSPIPQAQLNGYLLRATQHHRG